MKILIRSSRLAVILLITVVTAACTTMKPVPVESIGTTQVQSGDKVRIITRDGKLRTLRVTETSAQEIVGEPEEGKTERIAVDQIVSIEREQISAGRTALAAGGVYLLYGIIAGIAFWLSLAP